MIVLQYFPDTMGDLLIVAITQGFSLFFNCAPEGMGLTLPNHRRPQLGPKGERTPAASFDHIWRVLSRVIEELSLMKIVRSTP